MNLANIGKKHLRLTLGSIVLVLLLSSVASLGAIWTAPKAFAANPAEWCEKAYGGVTSLVSQCTAGEIDLDLKAVGQLYCSENYSSNSNNLRGCQEAVEKYFSMSANSRSNSNRDEFCGGNGTGQVGMTTGSSISCAASWSYLQTVEADVAAWQLRNESVNGEGIGENPDDTGVASSIKREDECVAAGFEWVDGACTNPTEDKEPTCGSEVKGVGWLICPGLDAAAGFADAMWGIFEFLMFTNPLKDPSVNNVWLNFRNIANVLLVVVFLVIVFSQVSNIGINNYGIKKLLPRLIIVAIAINISFFLMQVIVDVANILGKTVDSLLAQNSIVALDGIGWGDAITSVLAGGAMIGAGVITGVTIGIGPLLILILLLLIPALIAFIAGLAALIFRQAILPILAVLAPLALVAYVLPNTQSIFDKWRKTFTGLLFLYPLAAMYYGGLKLGANIIAGTVGGWFGPLIAVFVLFFGAGAVIILAIKSNSIAGKAFGAVSGVLGKAAAPVQKWGKDVGRDKRADFIYGQQRKGIAGFAQRTANSFAMKSRRRAGRQAAYAEIDKDAYKDRLANNPEAELGAAITNTPTGQAYVQSAEEAKTKRARDGFERKGMSSAKAMETLIAGKIKDKDGDEGRELSTAERKALRSMVVEAGDAKHIESLWNQSSGWQDQSERNSFAADLSRNKPTGVGRGDIGRMREGDLKEFRDVLAANAVKGAYNAQGSASADASEVDMLSEVLADSSRMSRVLIEEGKGAGQINAVRQKVANDANTAITDSRLGAGKNRDSLKKIVDTYRRPGP